jgi:hypothetical protein
MKLKYNKIFSDIETHQVGPLVVEFDKGQGFNAVVTFGRECQENGQRKVGFQTEKQIRRKT